MANIVTSVTVKTFMESPDAATMRGVFGLQNVDNTADADKPVSTAQATADALVASNATAADAVVAANAAAADAVVAANATAADAVVAANAASALAGQVSVLNTAIAGKQPLNANLTAEAALVGAADRLSYYTGIGAKALATFTAFARTLLAAADASAALTALGVSVDAVAGTGSLRTIGTGALQAASGRQSNVFAALAYTATLTLDASTLTLDAEKAITITGNMTVNAPTGATGGQVIRLWLLASGAWTVTLNGAIKIPTGFTFNGAIASGARRLLELRHNGNYWSLTSNLEMV